MKKWTDAEISAAIEETLAAGNKVIIGTDWHLIRFDKNASRFYTKPDCDDIIRMQNEMCGEDDVFLFLGDLVDDEVSDFVSVYELLGCRAKRQLTGKYKFMVRGNNDTFADRYYQNIGFDDVKLGIRYKDIFFTHVSVPLNFNEEIACKTNIHGHMHRDGTPVDSIAYYHSWPNDNICVCTDNCRPIDLTEIINHLSLWKDKNCNHVEGLEKPGMSRFLSNACFDKMLGLFDID